MLVSVERTVMFDNNTLAVDCSDEEFRTSETSLYQVLHRTTANDPLKIVQQTRGQKGFEARRAAARRYDQWNMSDNKSAYIALIITLVNEIEPKTWINSTTS